MTQARTLNHGFTSPLRYPGGKGSLSKFLKQVIVDNDLLDGHYVEAFAGGAGVAWSLLFGEYVEQVHINDLDRSIYSFWSSVLDQTDDLCRMIHDTRVNMRVWHNQKEIQAHACEYDTLDLGFSTFFLNRTNRSGIISGGVIGGKEQLGQWKLDARFNKKDLVSRIQRIARFRNRISVYGMDGNDFLGQVLSKLPRQTLVYIDPPYYVKGKGLYQNHLTHCDHESIARTVQRRVGQPWIVSYDNVPEIAALYSARRSRHYRLSYSVQARYSGEEVMFFSDDVVIPDSELPIKPSRSS